MSAPAEATEALLGGRVRLAPGPGLKPTTDAVLLAAAVTATDRVLDAGCGAGAASLCLAARVASCRITGLERAAGLVAAARANVARNGFTGRIEIVEGELAAPPPALAREGFDAVMTNPPYLDPAVARGSPDPLRRAATVETMPLADWLAACLALLRPAGELVVVHRADRLADLLAGLAGRAGAVAVLPLWPDDAGRAPARRVLVRARKGARGPLALLPGLALHRAGGGYTAAAEEVLRGGGALAWA